MNKHRNHDFDDGFDEESLFEDEEFTFERTHKRREHRLPTKSPRNSWDDGASRHSDKPIRRGELAALKAWGTPY